MMRADQSWFKIAVEGGPEFGVYAFEGREKLNEPYEFEVEVVSLHSNLDMVDLIGKQALLTVLDHSGGSRLIHGSIRQTEQLHTANLHTHYKLWLVPRLWFLGLNQEHRIFQNKSVVDIIDEILVKEQGFRADQVLFPLKEKYEPREYCVQYRESDLHFISRLCEEEGIYFYFEHTADNHVLCFSDASGGHSIPGFSGGLLRFFPGSGQAADAAVIKRLKMGREVKSDTAAYREWNFTQPHLTLAATAEEPEHEAAPRPGGLSAEKYQFPHLYNLAAPGERYAAVELLRQLTFSRWAEGESDVATLLPGFAFTLYEHPRLEANAQWWLTEVRHTGRQPQVLGHEAPESGFFYANAFTAIPFETRFVPEIRHKKAFIEGLQSAIVTGPSGEEVYVDKYGRVKLHFHWDRLGPMDGGSSCWVRVSDVWAGSNFGFIQPPRIGQEVLVEFMEGDPDRPVVTGRVYNAEKMPPWKLPEQKNLSGIQSRELRGDQRNQLVMDDTARQVQLQLSSDHELSQMNLGYLHRIEHVAGRGDFRGEGFELRTDAWGAVRAGKGLFISTHERRDASGHHKDMAENTAMLSGFVGQQANQADLAAQHNAQPDEPAEIAPKLEAQLSDIGGTGQHSELAAPHISLSSQAGLAMTTPQSLQAFGGGNMFLTAGKNISMAAGKSLVASALQRVTLFAYKAGMKLFAAKGKVEIQAQNDELEIIADKVLQLISVDGKVHISSPTEILLTAGESYVKIDASGVESGTNSKFTINAAKDNFIASETMPPVEVELPGVETLVLAEVQAPYSRSFVLNDEKTGEPLVRLSYNIYLKDGTLLASGITNEQGETVEVMTEKEEEIYLTLLNYDLDLGEEV